MKLLVTKHGKTFFVKDTSKDYHTQFGFVKKNDLKKKTATSNTGEEFTVLKAGFMDMYTKIKRQPQIITLKDIGVIIAETGIGRNSVVVDAGVGSGALACFLANIVKKVVSYDIRDDFIKVARHNAEFLGLKNLTIKHGSIYEPISEKNVDLVTLDVPEPWKAMDVAAKALKPGGFLVSYSPTIIQTADFVNSLKGNSFIHIKTLEVIQREWEVRDRKVRPQSTIINHTGFLTILRRM